MTRLTVLQQIISEKGEMPKMQKGTFFEATVQQRGAAKERKVTLALGYGQIVSSSKVRLETIYVEAFGLCRCRDLGHSLL